MSIAYLTGFELDLPVTGYVTSGWTVTTSATYGGSHNNALINQVATDHADSHQPSVGYGGGGRCVHMQPETFNHWNYLQTPENLMDNSAGAGLSEYVLSFSFKALTAHQTGGNRVLMSAYDSGYALDRLFDFTQTGTGTATKYGVTARLQTGNSGSNPTYTTQASANKCFTYSGGGSWHFVQIVVKQHATAGVFKLIVNNIVEIDYSGPLNSFITGATSKTEKVAFEMEGSHGKFDHFVVYNAVADETEARYEKHVQGLMPSGNDSMGTFVRAGASAGSPIGAAWTDVNGDATTNPESFDAAKYVESSVGASPATDNFTLEVQNRSVVHASFAPTHVPSVAIHQMVHGTENAAVAKNRISGDGSGFTDGTAWQLYDGDSQGHLIWQNWNTNPQTSNDWTGSDLDNLKIGFKKV